MELIEEFIKKFTKDDIKNVIGNKIIIKVKKNFFLANAEQSDLLNKLKIDVEVIGIYLGKEEDKKFIPSINLIDILSKKSDKKVFVDAKGEWMFLCKNNIIMTAIKKKNESVKREEFVLVQNSNDENLGYGIYADTQHVAVRGLLDKGDYLRREMK